MAQHPIARTALSLLAQEPGSDELVLPREGDLTLRDSFTGHFLKGDLREAAEELAIVAWFLEKKQKSPRAAASIRKILSDAEAILRKAGVELAGLFGGDSLERQDARVAEARKMFKKTQSTDPRVSQHADAALAHDLNAARVAASRMVPRAVPKKKKPSPGK